MEKSLTSVTEIKVIEGAKQHVMQHDVVEIFDEDKNSCGTLQLLDSELLFFGYPEPAARVLFDNVAKLCVDHKDSDEFIVLSFSDDDGNLKYSAKVSGGVLVLTGKCNRLADQMLGHLKEFTDTYIATM